MVAKKTVHLDDGTKGRSVRIEPRGPYQDIVRGRKGQSRRNGEAGSYSVIGNDANELAHKVDLVLGGSVPVEAVSALRTFISVPER